MSRRTFRPRPGTEVCPDCGAHARLVEGPDGRMVRGEHAPVQARDRDGFAVRWGDGICTNGRGTLV